MATILKNLARTWLTPSGAPRSGMAVFAPYYIEPLFKKDVLAEKIESGEIDPTVPMAVRPPLIDQTCSTYQTETIRKFTNMIMLCGQKRLATNLLDKTFEIIKRTQIEKYHMAIDQASKDAIELDPQVILDRAIENCRPIVDLMPVKRGGVKYQVPVPLREKRSYFISMRWLIRAAREREDRKILFPDTLASELLDAAYNRGKVIKQKQDLHKQCEANRAYAHYRWS